MFPESINGSLKALQTIANSGEQYIDDRQNPSRVHRRHPSREPSAVRLGRYDPESLSMPPPATRRAPSGAPFRDAPRARQRRSQGPQDVPAPIALGPEREKARRGYRPAGPAARHARGPPRSRSPSGSGRRAALHPAGARSRRGRASRPRIGSAP